MTLRLNFLLAAACGLILANLYYTQPIISIIANDIGLHESASGLIVTLAQTGYCAGVLFLVPLGDRLENRRLIVLMVFGSALVLTAAGLCTERLPFFISVLLIGLCTSVVQLVIPYGASLALDGNRGRVVGLIASGAILGIVLARPAAGFLTDAFSWRACFFLSALMMVGLGFILRATLPLKKPASTTASYAAMLVSMGRMLHDMPLLRLRVLLMALVFAAFALFWATVPIVLKVDLAFSPADIAFFSLAGSVAPVCAVIAGRLSDRGLGFRTVLAGLLLLAVAFLSSSCLEPNAVFFILSVVLIDCGVHTTNVITQQSVLSLRADARSRLNAVCISITFGGGAIGSALGPWIYAHYGWQTAAGSGFVLATLALTVHLRSRYLMTSPHVSAHP